MRNLIKLYSFKLKNFIWLEILRGILIIFAAWLMMRTVESILKNNIETNYILILFLILSLRLMIENILNKKFIELSLKFQKSVRSHLHRHLLTNYNVNSGELLTLIFETVESFDELIVKVLPNILSILTLLPLILIISLMFDFMTTLIFLFTLPIAPFLLYLIGKTVSIKNQQAWSALSKLNGDFKELLSAITTLKIFRRINPALEKLKVTSEQSAIATLEVLKLAFISSFALELITTLSIALIAVTIGLRLIDYKVTFDVAFFLLLLAPEFFSPIRNIGVAFHSAVKAKDALNLINKYLQRNEDKLDISSTIIKLQNVSFTYPNKIAPTLENINMTFKVGAVTVITGESGSGKSTLLKILAGLYSPTSGTILIDSNIAYLPQQPHLFETTVHNNLTLFKPANDKQIKNFLKAVNLDLNLNDEVRALSRGQLQRLGLVRVLLQNANILILDEPTAGLDIDTEQIILKLLNEYKSSRTIIVASHRSTMIDFADEIFRLKTLTF